LYVCRMQFGVRTLILEMGPARLEECHEVQR
jgi:hypothetical protein